MTMLADAAVYQTLASLTGAIAVLIGAFVGYQSWRSKSKTDANGFAITSLEAALARNDTDRENDRKYLQGEIDTLKKLRIEDHEECEAKLKKLAGIVRELGGKIPDELSLS